jgi:hypothetical protein
MEQDESIREVASQLGIAIKENNFQANRQELADKINEMIQYDFQQLVSLLYRIDVSEKRLQQMLEENSSDDAGCIIADLLMERQLQKIRSRQQFSRRDDNIDENEKW